MFQGSRAGSRFNSSLISFFLFLSSTNGHQETGCGGVETPLRMIYNHHPTLRGLVLPPLLMGQSYTHLSEQRRNTDIRSSRTLFHPAASLFLSTESLRFYSAQTGTSDFRSANDCRDYCPCLITTVSSCLTVWMLCGGKAMREKHDWAWDLFIWEWNGFTTIQSLECTICSLFANKKRQFEWSCN